MSLANFLFTKHFFQILKSLEETPLRYVDMKDVCENESTRSRKVRILEENKLIETISMKIRKKSYVHYKLTDKGRKVLELLKGVEEI